MSLVLILANFQISKKKTEEKWAKLPRPLIYYSLKTSCVFWYFVLFLCGTSPKVSESQSPCHFIEKFKPHITMQTVGFISCFFLCVLLITFKTIQLHFRFRAIQFCLSSKHWARYGVQLGMVGRIYKTFRVHI